ncbi:MAG TPA: acyltransferase family protein [Pyrinomonadaceae bacterium]|nr:acyltransferase family protein [Pyrinomonadaceae bacterium]
MSQTDDNLNNGEAVRPSGSGGRIEGLDGLRAFAVLFVLVYHLWPKTLPGGFLGVDVFFVISGYLITTLLLREKKKTGRVALSAFWIRRARRLLPALLLVVVSAVATAWLVNYDLLVNIGRQVFGALTFSTNWVEIVAGTDYFADSARSLFITFWSLAVEEQFYLFWPILFLGLITLTTSRVLRVAFALIAAATSVVLMAVLYNPQMPTRVYYGTDTHSFGLMIGVALAFALSESDKLLSNKLWSALRPVIGFAGLAGMMVLVVFVESEAPFTYRGGLLQASILSAATVAVLPGHATIFTKLCKIRALAWVGERSYGIYLWHWPVLLVVLTFIPPSPDSVWSGWVAAAIVIFTTFVLSAASFRWIEVPIRNNGFKATWAAIRGSFQPISKVFGVPGISAACVFAVSIMAVLGLVNAPEKSRAQIAVELGEQAIAEQNAKNLPQNIKAPNGLANLDSEPAWPADQKIPTGDRIVGFGDSVMSGAAPAVYERFPGIIVNARPILQWADAPGLVKDMIDKGTMRRVVILNFGTNAGFKEPASEQALRDILNMLGPKRRVVLVNTVGVSYWVPDANARLAEISAEYPNTIVADWYSVVKKTPNILHRDRTHPNEAGIVLYAGVIADALAALGPG